MKRSLVLYLVTLVVLLGLSLAGSNQVGAQSGDDDPLTKPVPILVPEVISVRDHDPNAFTQGFFFYDGRLFESAGQYGELALREDDPQTGAALRTAPVDAQYFAEGLERVGDKLIQLTWKEGTALVYDLETFEQTGTFSYTGEGWGLCYDGRYLYMSDGSSFLTLRDPNTFDVVFRGVVTYQGTPVIRINELECVGDYVYANVWQTNYILQIDKMDGVVVGLIDASTLLTPEETAQLEGGSVLNGIAYNSETDTFLITGKRWPKMFEVRFVPAETESPTPEATPVS